MNPTLQDELTLISRLKELPLPDLNPRFWENNIGVIRAKLALEKNEGGNKRRSFALGLSSLAASLLLIFLFVFAERGSLFHSSPFLEEDFLDSPPEESFFAAAWRDLDEDELSSLYSELLTVDFPVVEIEMEGNLEAGQDVLPENLSDDEFQTILNQLESIEI